MSGRDIFTSVTSSVISHTDLTIKDCCIHVSDTDIFELVFEVQSLTPILNFYATILQDLGPELQCLLRVKEDLSTDFSGCEK